MRAALAAAFLSLAAACASGPRPGPPPDPDAAAERLYRGHCAACHPLLEPGQYTADWWERAVRWFGPQAQLTEEEQRLVLVWLTARAKKPPPENAGAR